MSPRLTGGVVLLAIAAVVVLVVVSGDDGSEDSRATRAGSWRPLSPALLSRTEVAAARVGRFIYVMGGFERRSNATTAAVERYDIDMDRWRRVRSMPLALNHPAATAYKGHVYVLGGYTGRGSLRGEVSAFLRYEPKRNYWSRMPSAPTRRAALAVGMIGQRLFAAGGANKAGALKTLEVFDFRRRRWSRGPDMALAREHLAGAVADGAFYVLAGRAAGRGNFKVAERYVPKKHRWERLPEMRKPRGGIAAARVGRRIVVFGGEEASGTIAEVELYDPQTRRWSTLPAMRTPRHGLGGISRGRQVFAIEGGPTPGFDFSNAIEALDIAP